MRGTRADATLSWAPVLVGLVACTGGAPSASDGLVGVWPPTKPYQTHGDEGSIVMRGLDWPAGTEISVHALFGDDLQGIEAAAGCAQGVLPCVGPRAEVGGDVDARGSSFRLEDVDSRWVGDRMSIGPVFAELIHDTDRGVAWYRGAADQAPQAPFRIRFGGEWSDFDQTPVPFEEDFRVVEPALGIGERLLLRDEPIDFRWISRHDNEVWLWARGDRTQRLYDLDDDGHFRLDPDDLGLIGAEVVEVGLAAVAKEQIDVDGNALEVITMRGSAWKGSRCQDIDAPVENVPPEGEMEHPLYYSYRFRGVIDEGIRDYREAGQPVSATLTFTFYGEGISELCEIVYDASDGGRTRPLLVDSGAELYASYRVPLFNGASTCGLVDPSITGFSDLRNWLEQFDWGFALGEVKELEPRLRDAYGEDNWNAVEPITFGMFWTKDGLLGEEHNFADGMALSSCNSTEGFGAPLRRPRAGESLAPGYYETNPYWVFPILQ